MGGRVWLVSGFFLLACGGEEFSGKPSTGGSAGQAATAGSGGSAGGGGSAGSGGTAGSSGSGGSAGAAANGGQAGTGGACSGECVTIPAAWLGPVLLRNAACSGNYGAEVLKVNSGLTVTEVCPACQCNGPSCEANVKFYLPNCESSVTLEVNVGSSCSPITLPESKTLKVTPKGACTSVTQPPLPAPTWATSQRLCAPSAAGSCGAGEACVPSAPGARCVYQKADVPACPAGFPVRTLSHEGFTDARSCAGCACTATCAVEVNTYTNASCLSGAETCSSPTDCCPITTGAPVSLRMTSANPNAAPPVCVPSAMTGKATPKDPVTVCCTE